MPVPPNIVEKYRRVMALANGGVGGERRNARRILDKMEEQHPGIAEAAQAAQAAEKRAAYAGPPPPASAWPPSPGPYEGGIFHRDGWTQVLRGAAREAASAFAEGFAQRTLGLTQDDASVLMDRAARAAGRVTRGGNLVVDLRIDNAELMELVQIAASSGDLRLLADAGAEMVFERLFDALEDVAEPDASRRRK